MSDRGNQFPILRAIWPRWPSPAFDALRQGSGKGSTAAEAAEAPTPVTVETAVRGAIDHVVTADAVLYPINQANVTPKISAPVKRILVNRGDHVRAGQVLAELESADLAAAANESKHQYRAGPSRLSRLLTGATVREDQTKAQADVQSRAAGAGRRARSSTTIARRCRSEGALAQKLVDDAKVAMVQAQSQFDTAQRHLAGAEPGEPARSDSRREAQMNAAKAHYDNAPCSFPTRKIRSPISGIVVGPLGLSRRNAAPAATPLVSIVDISQVVARANVPVKDAAASRSAGPRASPDPTAISPARSRWSVPRWIPTPPPSKCGCRLPIPARSLKPGGTVRVAIIAETIQNTIVVPASALLNADEGGQKVMVVDKRFGRARAQGRPSASARAARADRQRRAGRRQVVTSGGLGLEDKAKVTIQQPKTEDEDEDDDDDDRQVSRQREEA